MRTLCSGNGEIEVLIQEVIRTRDATYFVCQEDVDAGSGELCVVAQGEQAPQLRMTHISWLGSEIRSRISNLINTKPPLGWHWKEVYESAKGQAG